MSEHGIPPGNGIIVAKAYRNYRLTRYALVVFLFGYGVYCLYDGFVRYPRENAEALQKGVDSDKLPHRALDIPFNRVFGIVLPPLSLLLLGFSLYSSRGEIRFDGSTLTAPGHPTVPITAITQIDRSRWERKSIAFIHYKLPETGETGRIRIDHSRYDPVDKLYKQVEVAVQGMVGLPSEAPAARAK